MSILVQNVSMQQLKHEFESFLKKKFIENFLYYNHKYM